MNNLPLVIHAAIGWVISLALLVVLFAAAAVTGLFATDLRAHWHRWSSRWSRWALAANGVDLVVEDRERLQRLLARGPVILACNHQSMLDIAILLAGVPGGFGFLSKVEVFKLPFFGATAELFGCIPLKRGDRASASLALVHAEAALREGRTVLIFPEGTRTSDGALAHFKRGAMLLSQRSGVPVLPLAIAGSYALMPRHTLLTRPGTVALRAGPLITPPRAEAEVELASLALHEKVLHLLDRPESTRAEPAGLPETNLPETDLPATNTV